MYIYMCDLGCRVFGISRVTLWVIGFINLVTKSHDPLSSNSQCHSLRIS